MNTPNSPVEGARAGGGRSSHLIMAFAVGTMTLCGGTGLLMFFHARGPLMNELHLWSGLALVVAVAAHLVRCRRPLVNHLRHWPVRGMLVLALVLLAVAAMTTRFGRAHGGAWHGLHASAAGAERDEGR